MRHYALLLGILMTSGSAFVLHLAVDSGGFARLYDAPASASELAAPKPMDLWYGGTLPAITIEARRGASPAAVAWVRMLEGSKREACSPRANLAKAANAIRERRRPAVGVDL
jgi:hypothetical protein